MIVSTNELDFRCTPVQMRVFCALAILLALILLGYCIWILDRAFDITDESYYLLLAIQPESVMAYNSAQHWVTSGLWQISGTLSSFRFVGLSILLLSGTVLSIGTLSLISRSSRAFPVGNLVKYAVISSTWIAAMVYGATINFSPCYNLLATAGAYAGLGFAFFAVSQPSKHWVKFLSYLLSGMALAIGVISKASAGVATLGLVLLIVSAGEADIRARVLGIVSILGSLIVALFVIMLANTTPNEFVDAFRLGMFMFRQVQTATIADRLWRYGDEMLVGIYSITQVFFAPILLGVLFSFYKKSLLGFISISSLFLILVLGEYYLGGTGQYHKIVSTALVLIGLAVVVAHPFASSSFNHRMVFVALFVLPYTVAVGSGNSFYTQIIISLASWGTLISILAILGSEKQIGDFYLLFVWLIFLSALVVQTVSSGFRNPYNLNLPIAKQGYETSVAAIGGVKVDQETFQFIASLNDAVQRCRIKPGSPFLGLYNNPGLALVIDAVPIVSPWLNNVEQADTALELVDSKTINDAVLGLHVNQNGNHSPLPKKITNFPAGYTHCGSAVYPWQNRIFQIWMPHGRNI